MSSTPVQIKDANNAVQPVAADQVDGHGRAQLVKLLLGGLGDDEGPVSASNPMPVVQQGAVALDAGTLAALESIQAATGGLTDDQLRAQALQVAVDQEVVEALEAIRMATQALTRSIGQMMPDAGARMRVAIDAITTGLTLATVTTVTTVSTVTNQAQMGGWSANDQIPALLHMSADGLRANISVT